MAPNKAFIYKTVPHGWPEPGKNLTIEDITFDPDTAPPSGGFTTKNLYAAFDPSQRGRMRDPAIQSYSPAMEAGKPVISVSVIGIVQKSDAAKIKEGMTVMVMSAYTESFSAHPAAAVERTQIIEEKKGVPLTAYLGLLGMTGMTAYGSLHEIGEPKKGDVILVSAAAGAVGQMVCQIAVREGLYVIGSAGDDAKVEFLKKELGVQAAFNYKKEGIADAIKKYAPEGLDIFYDNVGGEMLDTALLNMKMFGRIVACGSISQYNNKGPEDAYGIKNSMRMVVRRLKWQGFLVYDPNIMKHHQARNENISKWIADGSFKSFDHVTDGMENAVDGFLGMLKGENLGKSVLKIQEA